MLILTAVAAWAMACWPWWEVTHTTVVGHGDEFQVEYEVDEVVYNTTLIWPVLALVAFLAWKAVWAVVERRRARAGSAPPVT